MSGSAPSCCSAMQKCSGSWASARRNECHLTFESTQLKRHDAPTSHEKSWKQGRRTFPQFQPFCGAQQMAACSKRGILTYFNQSYHSPALAGTCQGPRFCSHADTRIRSVAGGIKRNVSLMHQSKYLTLQQKR